MSAKNRSLSLAEAPVESIMTKDVKVVQPSESLAQCVKVMKDSNIGSILVVQNQKPLGIFTERDLIRQMAEGPENLEHKVEKFMSQPLITISASTPVWDALSLMENRKIRRLPVIKNNGELAGIVTERDVMRLILTLESLTLESVAPYIPANERESLKGIIGTLHIEPLPQKLEAEE